MRLARVITGLDQYSGELTLELLKQGFEVQTSSTAETSSVTPDLEITLNQCAPEAAGTLIGDSPGTRDMCVFVTPQAMAGHIRSIGIYVLTPNGNPETEKVEGESANDPGELSKAPGSAKVIPFESASSLGAPTPEPELLSDQNTVVPSQTSRHAGQRDEESELVPHGMIWQASNQDDAASGDFKTAEHGVLHFMPQEENRFVETIRSLVSAAIKFSDHKLQRMRSSAAKARMGGILDLRWFKTREERRRKPGVTLPAPAVTSLEKSDERPIFDAPARSNGRQRDTRLWNAMVMAIAASLVALIVALIAGHYSASRISTSDSTATSPTPNSSMPKPDQPSATESKPAVATGKVSPSRAHTPLASKNETGTRASAGKRDSKPTTRRNLDADYVAKATTVYFTRRSGAAKTSALAHN
ncbi:MAG: hypothetical protein NVS1B11_30250 [Terriglobales bacterium]